MANILKLEKKVAAISMLAEGASIRAVERMTGIHGDTIGRLALRVGTACQKIMDEKMRNLNCQHIEVDEIWGFIGAKRKNAERAGVYGDVWTYIALDAETKLIPSFVVGKRDMYHTRVFMEDLASRLSHRIQLSTDAMHAYPVAVDSGFGGRVDYGQIVKTYSVTQLTKEAATRYSPGGRRGRKENYPRQPQCCPNHNLARREAESHPTDALPTPDPVNQRFQ